MCVYGKISRAESGAGQECSPRSEPLEAVPHSRLGRDYGPGIGWLKRLRRTERASPGPGVGISVQKGTEEAMSTVDLGRVGACVLKHAVTGEVRFGWLRAENASKHLVQSAGNSHGLEWRC